MLRMCGWLLGAGCVILACDRAQAGMLAEDFSSDPTLRGWRSFGNAGLFSWNEASATLSVTWDSSTSNSYFFHALGTVLTRQDDFSLEFDLRLQDIAPSTKSGPFEIAVGFINLADATRSDLRRGSGVNETHGPRNIVEFDYFPAGYYPDWGEVAASVSPTMVSSNNIFAAGFCLVELTNNRLVHVALDYTASNSTLRTVLTCDGAPVGPVDDVVLGSTFTDFRLDTVAVCSYSDTGNDYDSVLAHGAIDNLTVRTPPPPVETLTGAFSNGVWQVQFTSQTNWTYNLERTTEFQTWQPVGGGVRGTGTTITLPDLAAPVDRALYRLRADRD